MGLFDMFKKEKPLDEISPLPDLSQAALPPLQDSLPGGMNPPAFGAPEPSQPFSPTPSFDHPIASFTPSKPDLPSYDKDFQLILARLDTIRSELDSINQRVIHIEKIAESSQDKQPMKRYGWQ
ncbi:MAG: hypothetical protein ABIJ21_09055 [Nanoarchaeota archaeon]